MFLENSSGFYHRTVDSNPTSINRSDPLFLSKIGKSKSKIFSDGEPDVATGNEGGEHLL